LPYNLQAGSMLALVFFLLLLPKVSPFYLPNTALQKSPKVKSIIFFH